LVREDEEQIYIPQCKDAERRIDVRIRRASEVLDQSAERANYARGVFLEVRCTRLSPVNGLGNISIRPSPIPSPLGTSADTSANMGNEYSLLFPPKPTFTEKELPDQTGKVFIVTGASAGVGKALAEILYSHNATVYVAGRSETKGQKAIDDIKLKVPSSKGQVVFLQLDLADLTTIKKSADEFLAKETRLDVLWNNAGVMVPPQGSKTAQGYELQLGTNCLGAFLFTKSLTPLLVETAKTAPPNSVRVIWLGSSATELSPKDGVVLDNLDYKKDQITWTKYAVSKTGNYYYGTEYAKRYKDDGIISVSLNPGNLKTELQRHVPWWQYMMFGWILYEPIYGAYTELFAGLSPAVTAAESGVWIQPWGRIAPIRKDLEAGSRSETEGGTGVAKKFWEWSDKQVKPFE